MDQYKLRLVLSYKQVKKQQHRNKDTATGRWLFKLLFTVHDWNVIKTVLDLVDLHWLTCGKLVQSKRSKTLQRDSFCLLTVSEALPSFLTVIQSNPI